MPEIEITKYNHDTHFEIIQKDSNGTILSETVIYGEMTDQKCEKCGETMIHASDYDAEFCPVCNEWNGPPCSPNCHHCGNRPERPFDKWPKGY